VGPDRVVGMASHYGLDRPHFPHPSTQALGPTQPPVKWVWDLFGGGMAAFRPLLGVDHPSQSRSEVKDRTQLYLYFPPGLYVVF
jgi:hypothetical protein